MTDIDVDRVRAETPGTAHGIHLLASGSALPPRSVLDAVVDHLRLEAEIGGYEAHAARATELDAVYDLLAAHLNAGRHEVAVMENATVAWCHAFHALPLARGTRILTGEAEYAANYVSFLQRARRDGLRIEVVPSDATGALDVDALRAMVGDDVGLIAVTWIPTNGGLVNPAAEIGAIAKARGIPYLLDGCQAAGQMPIDVKALGCDVFSATGRKFLRAPRGTGFLYVAEERLRGMEPAMIDHFAAPWTARDGYTLRDDARRFETWENAYALRAGLAEALRYADGLGMDAIRDRIRSLAAHARSALAALDRVTLRDLGADRCGIVSFTVDGADPAALKAACAAARIAIGTSSPDSTRLDSERRALPVLLRLSPHVYNTEAEIDRCVEVLAAAIG